jgi:hypothetical protein
MPEISMPDEDDERASKLDAALAESQRLEREERDADLDRQVKTDQALSEALSKRPKD